jgi:hypothetical protein
MSEQLFTIYKISGKGHTYVGMTTQTLSKRFAQHKHDAKKNVCSISNRLCQKTPPSDLKALHRWLKENPKMYSIEKVKDVSGSYTFAHAEEQKVKSKLATVK